MPNWEVQIKLLRQGDEALLSKVDPELFDEMLQPRLITEFLGDTRHHLAVALDDGSVVGMASAVHYIHPDKDAELWINEVGVIERHRRRGVGKQLLAALFDVGRQLGCTQAWVLTERSNEAAMNLYTSVNRPPIVEDAVMFTFKL